MAKPTNYYECVECGAKYSKWAGRCSACGAYNALEERQDTPEPSGKRAVSASGAPEAVDLTSVAPEPDERSATGIGELDRVLCGGLVRGSLTLLGGEPGIGKSTLLLDLCAKAAEAGKSALYISGEESARQIRLRARRMGISAPGIMLLSETDADRAEAAAMKLSPGILVVDSIQTMRLGGMTSAAGSVAQVRECAARFMRLAKDEGITTVLVGHVTKEGELAGPRVLEHIVDAVLYFEGERRGSYRVLRAVKNRFGSTGEVGVFEMRGDGLIGIKNPSAYMLAGRPVGVSGSVVTATVEGTRPMLAEIQALAASTGFNMPRRVTSGIDFNRAAMLTAVLEKRAGLNFAQMDLYLNVAGGYRIIEPAADAAICAALASSFRDRPIGSECLVFGEIGLAGEARSVTSAEARLREAARLGFTNAIIPSSSMKGLNKPDGMTVYGVGGVGELLELLA
ncbi:MAG: DNA repair protein RadA [Clostridiales bacterium]|nr:DNA repair protein RadA [Clostridiales bacterium]